MKAHMAIVQQAQQAQQLHEDQIALATGKPGQPKLGEPKEQSQQKKPPAHSGKISGAHNANAPIQ